MAEEGKVVLSVTDITSVPEVVERVRAGFRSHKTIPKEHRVQQLRQLKKLIEENEKKISEALWHDLRKNEFEAIMMESNLIRGEIIKTLNDIDKWMEPEYVSKDFANKMNTVYIQPEPYGTVLIVSPWNYPFQLCMAPLVGAIAAGNTCVLKPSESSIATSNLVAELIPKYLDNECYAVVTGGVDVSQTLLKERWDYIFYTGGTNVGKVVMRHAAENLTPVTLELGGKSPCIIADDANIDVAGRRLIWGKLLNAGQTCIAPDYVLCTPTNRDRLIEVCKKSIQEFYGEDPKSSKDFGRIISDRHFQRVEGLLQSTKGTVVYGGETDQDCRYIAPTLIVNVSPEDKIMKEEIFGPLLPFVTVDNTEKAIEFVNDREKPLAFYVFTESKQTFQTISRLTSAGGVTHNDVLMHAGIDTLPFGGVGYSGCGAYHGKFTFDTFTHRKAVLSVSTSLEGLNKIRYAPFSKKKLGRIMWLLSPSERKSPWPLRLLLLVVLVAIAAVAIQVFGVPSWVYRLGN